MEEVGLDLFDEGFVAVEASGGYGAVDGLAVVAVVLRGDVGCDELALAGGEGVGGVEEDVDEIVEGAGGLRAEGHRAADAGEIGGEIDVGHACGFLSRVVAGGAFCVGVMLRDGWIKRHPSKG